MTGKAQFVPARQKLWIASLDMPELGIRAQYNPKDLKVSREITWEDPRAMAGRGGGRRGHDPAHNDLDFTGLPQRTMSVDLLFDGYETGRSIARDVTVLETLATVYNREARCEHERRPHHCLVGWGGGQEAMPPFRCVIYSLTTTFTMWDTNGRPLRATCAVGLKEAHYLAPWLSDGARDRRPLLPLPDWHDRTVAERPASRAGMGGHERAAEEQRWRDAEERASKQRILRERDEHREQQEIEEWQKERPR